MAERTQGPGGAGGRASRGFARPAGLALAVAACLVGLGTLVWTQVAVRASTAGVARGCATQRAGVGTAAGAPGPAAGIGLGEWTSFQASVGHNSVFPGRSASGGALAVRWRFQTGGELSVGPSVVDGVAYLASTDGCVYALNVATGRELWAFHAPNMTMSQPLVVAGRVFFGYGNKTVLATSTGYLRGSGSSGVDALDAKTGRRLWGYPTGGEVMATLLYRGGAVYAAAGDSTFYALDAASGKLLWKVHDGSIDSMSSPVLAGGTAIFGGADPYAVYGVDLQTHRIAWSTPLGKGTPWGAEGGIDDVSPTVSGGLVFIQNPEGVYPNATVVEFALDAKTGRIVWQTELGQGIIPVSNREEIGVASLSGGTLYVGTPSVKGLWALDAATGRPLWSKPAPVPAGLRATPTVDGNHIFVTGGGWLWELDRATGAVRRAVHLGTPPTPQSCAGPPVTIVGNTALVRGSTPDTLEAVPLSALTAVS